jgi:hypothetical protein
VQPKLIEATAGFTALLAYDSLWTSDSREVARVAVQPLEMAEMALGFRQALTAAPGYAAAIATIANQEQFGEMSDDLRSLLEGDEDGRTTLQVVGGDGGLPALAGRAASEIAEATVDELKQLEADVTDVLNQRVAAGLFGKKFLCALARASMAAGLITVWIPPHAHALPAAKLGATVYATNGCSEGRGKHFRL